MEVLYFKRKKARLSRIGLSLIRPWRCSTFTWEAHTIIDRGRPFAGLAFGCFVSLLSLGDKKPKQRFAVRGNERMDT